MSEDTSSSQPSPAAPTTAPRPWSTRWVAIRALWFMGFSLVAGAIGAVVYHFFFQGAVEANDARLFASRERGQLVELFSPHCAAGPLDDGAIDVSDFDCFFLLRLANGKMAVIFEMEYTTEALTLRGLTLGQTEVADIPTSELMLATDYREDTTRIGGPAQSNFGVMAQAWAAEARALRAANAPATPASPAAPATAAASATPAVPPVETGATAAPATGTPVAPAQ